MTPTSDAPLQPPNRLGLNKGSYAGEKIDIAAVVRDCEQAAKKDWRIEKISFGSGREILALTRIARPTNAPARRAQNIYISAGIHGDEPAGPLAIRRLLEAGLLPPDSDYTIFPCLNPDGFALHQRENRDGRDLNREYLDPQAGEVQAHISWLESRSIFDLCLCLHEDWEAHGFYVYELNPDDRPSLAKGMIEAVSHVCPIDRSEVIEGRPAHEGIIRPTVDPRARPQWPESFYLLTHKTRLSYTLEAPSDFSLSTRVDSLVAAVRAALKVAPPSPASHS